MPAYEFRCGGCEEPRTLNVSVRDLDDAAAKLACLACGSTDLKRVYSAPAVTFHGTGFYKNDSRKGNRKD